MSSRGTTQIAKRVLKGVYSRIPFGLKSRFEQLVSPLSFRWFTRNMISLNSSLGTHPGLPVSIVIPSYNDTHLLIPLIKSLKRTLTGFQYEIIISDDYCEEKNSETLLKLSEEKVKVVFNNQRTGFAGAVNRGIKQAKYDVVLLNSDMIAMDYWLENLQAAAYNIDPKIGLVSPHLLYPTGRIQYGGTFHASVLAPQWFSHLDQGSFANDAWANVGKYVTAISGACVYIKKGLLDKIGGLDEGYWLGFEDVDLAFQARDLGYRSYLEPSSKLIHLESASRGKVQGFKEYASLRRFWDKWLQGKPAENKSTTVELFLSERASQSLKLIAEGIKTSLVSSGVEVFLHEVMVSSRTDEALIEATSGKNSYKVALDRDSVETVWLASQNKGTPVLFVPSLEDSGMDIESPKDRALFKPELTIGFGDPIDAETVASRIPWEIEKPIPSPAFVRCGPTSRKFTPLSSKSVRIITNSSDISSQLIQELATADIRVTTSTEKELLALLSETNVKPLDELVVFGNEFSSTSLPLTLMAKGIVFTSVFSSRTKFQVMDGFNTFCVNQGDALRASFIIKNLLSDADTQRSIYLNGLKTAEKLEQTFAHDFMKLLQGRSSEILPLSA